MDDFTSRLEEFRAGREAALASGGTSDSSGSFENSRTSTFGTTVTSENSNGETTTETTVTTPDGETTTTTTTP